jgi:putative ABC transport system permease protein
VNLSFAIKLAYRDARKGAGALFVMASAIVIGVAALVSVSSFKENLLDAVELQTREVLGADLVVRNRRKATPEVEKLLAEIPGEQSRGINLASMAYFPKSGNSRLIQVSAVSSSYPFFGRLVTEPAQAEKSYQQNATALVDKSIMLQFGLSPGEQVRIGKKTFLIEGTLLRVPGSFDVRSAIAPQIFIPLEELEQTGLVARGSLLRYRYYYKLPEGVQGVELAKSLRPQIRKHDLRLVTVEDRKEKLGEIIVNVYQFLDLIGFIAVLLGGIGVGSAASIYARRKRTFIATIRCLGASRLEALVFFAVQVLGCGLLCVLLGAVLGLTLQMQLPALLGDFIPVQVAAKISLLSLATSMTLGFVLLFSFALVPLWRAQGFPPLLTLRSEVESDNSISRSDVVLYGIALLLLVITCMIHVGSVKVAAAYLLGFSVVLGLLWLVSFFVRRLLRLMKGGFLPFSVRQGAANLFRPFNQTLTIMLCTGTAACVVCVVLFVERAIIARADATMSAERPNMILFDVQSDQREELTKFFEEYKMPLLSTVPIVNMRLESVKGVTVADLRKRDKEIPRWTLTREYRSTYRGTLSSTETLLSGKFVAEVDADVQRVPISLEERIARELKVSLGDELVFNVQGISLTTYVSSIRIVDWEQVSPNFFVVFPKGVIDAAPQNLVFVTRFATAEDGARFQRAAVEKFPNVSVVDLSLILTTLDTVVSKISRVIELFASFSIVTAIIVLAGAVWGTRVQRAEESVLLKTLGASRQVVAATLATEYLILGVCAAFSGVVIAVIINLILSAYVFEVDFTVAFNPAIVVFVGVVVTTFIVGVVGSGGTYRKTVLETIRGIEESS